MAYDKEKLIELRKNVDCIECSILYPQDEYDTKEAIRVIHKALSDIIDHLISEASQ